jgi:hypothetical protein
LPDLPYTELLPLPSEFQPTPELQVLLDALATRLGLLRKGGEKDLDVAREWLIKAFREGKIGRWTLDDLESQQSSRIGIEEEEVEQLLTTITPLAQEAVASSEAIEDKGRSKDLNAKVSATVQTFLTNQSAAQRASEEGRERDQSSSQRKKRDNQVKSEEREAKWRAKGIPVGVDRKTARARARGPARGGRPVKRR